MSVRQILTRGLGVLLVLVVAYQLWLLAHVWWCVDHNPESSAFMEQRLELLQVKNPEA